MLPGMSTVYPRRRIFAASDDLLKIEREVEEIRQEVMAISNIVLMDPKVRAIISKAKAQATLERIKPITHAAEMQRLLDDRRDRQKKIHERAKQIVRQHQSTKGKRPDLVYKTRVRRPTDV